MACAAVCWSSAPRKSRNWSFLSSIKHGLSSAGLCVFSSNVKLCIFKVQLPWCAVDAVWVVTLREPVAHELAVPARGSSWVLILETLLAWEELQAALLKSVSESLWWQPHAINYHKKNSIDTKNSIFSFYSDTMMVRYRWNLWCHKGLHKISSRSTLRLLLEVIGSGISIICPLKDQWTQLSKTY